MKTQILKHLRESCPWQDSLVWLDTVDSTNTLAKRLAAGGATHGTVIIADHQTGGRGRRGRSFHSPAGTGIYMSLILRPACAPGELMHLTCAAAVALSDAVECATGIRPGIKWTNDLVCGNRKIAGILTELGFTPQGTLDYAIIGAGLNCNQSPDDFPEEIRGIAGSLRTVTGAPADQARIAAAMMDAFFRMDGMLLTEKAEILARYRKNCITLGKEVSVVKADGCVRHATALSVDDQGALVVRFSDGVTETVNSGEVSIRGMYGYL